MGGGGESYYPAIFSVGNSLWKNYNHRVGEGESSWGGVGGSYSLTITKCKS